MKLGWLKKEIPPTAGLPIQWADLIPVGRRLEEDLANFLQVPATQIECSGTSALVITLSTLKLGSQRSKVIIPAYTCPLVALAIIHCGLTPVLCDVSPGSSDFDPAQLTALCDEHTLAIIPTHLGGRVADLQIALDAASSSGAHVIEDAAQSLGAFWQGKPVGSIGDAGFYSMAVGKGLTTYEGGILIAQDESLRQQLRQTSQQAIAFNAKWEIQRTLELLGYTLLYQPYGLTLAYGLPLRRALKQNRLIEAVGEDFSFDIPFHTLGEWRKNIAANALTRLPWFMAQLNAQAARRKARLAEINGITILDDAPGNQGTWPYFMILMPSEQARDAALAQLWPAGLGASRLFIHALPDYPYLAPHLASQAIPNARDFAARMLTVSNSLWLDDAAFELICAGLTAALGA